MALYGFKSLKSQKLNYGASYQQNIIFENYSFQNSTATQVSPS